MAIRKTKGIADNAFAAALATQKAPTLYPQATGTQTQGVAPVNQSLADAYSALHPEWAPPPDVNAQLPHPIAPVTFNPYSDPNYLLGAAGVEQNLTLAQGAYDYGTGTQGPQNYGYTYDPVTGGVKLEDSTAYGYNPYNQAAVLQRNYDNTQRGTTNSYAAQGQLYSGALKNAQNTNAYNFNRSSDAVQRSAGDYYHGLTSSLDAAKNGPFTKLVLGSLTSFLNSQQGS